MMQTFQQENLEAFLEELKPLLQAHFDAVGYSEQLPHVKPDFERYLFIENMGAYRAYTIRSEGILVGYAGFFLERNIHCNDVISAGCDVIYVRPEFRGVAFQFMAWCDIQLRMEKVSVVYHHVPTGRDFLKALNRLGYSPVEEILCKKL